MPAPDVDTFTRRLYDRLPEEYRDADEALGDNGGGYPLLRYLSGMGGRAGELEAILDTAPTLVDPELAAPAWLPWLAQLVGVIPTPGVAVAEQRVAIAGALGLSPAGSRETLAAVARRVLTPGTYVAIIPNLDGNPWRIGVVVADTGPDPDLDAILAAITDARAKPTGYELIASIYSASWDTLEAHYPTSDAWDAVPSSDLLEQTQP